MTIMSQIQVNIGMIKINSDDINLILLSLASHSGPSFKELRMEFPSFPSETAISSCKNIYGNDLKFFGKDTNANLRALGFIVYSYIFNQRTINTFLMTLFFEDLFSDCEVLHQIENCPYLQGLSKENKAKPVAQILIQTIKFMKEGKRLQNIFIIAELFGLCLRVFLVRQNLMYEASNYKLKLDSTRLFPYLFEKLDLDYIEKQDAFLFPEKHLFISSHDRNEYVCGHYFDNEADYFLNQAKINANCHSRVPQKNSALINFDQNNFGVDEGHGVIHYQEGRERLRENLTLQKFEIQFPQAEKNQINPIIEEDDQFEDISGIRNNDGCPIGDKYSISDFNPYECHSDEEQNQDSIKPKPKLVKEKSSSKFQSSQSLQNQTIASLNVHSQFRFQQNPKLILTFNKSKKTQSGIISDKKLCFKKNSLKTGPLSAPQNIENIESFLFKKKKQKLQFISKIYAWKILPTEIKTNYFSEKEQKRFSKMPEFLKNRHKRQPKGLHSIHSQGIIEPKIYFSEEDPSKFVSHHHTSSFPNKVKVGNQ